jgi:hypothetical protein
VDIHRSRIDKKKRACRKCVNRVANPQLSPISPPTPVTPQHGGAAYSTAAPADEPRSRICKQRPSLLEHVQAASPLYAPVRDMQWAKWCAQKKTIGKVNLAALIGAKMMHLCA